MDTYRLQLKIRSPLATPIQGDTVFGHICWGIAYHEGEKILLDFLASYNTEPQLTISNGFPHGRLPMPILTPSAPEIENRDALTQLKAIKKQEFVQQELFFDQSFYFSTETLRNQLPSNNRKNNTLKEAHRTHNTINRATGMVEEGGLYAVSEKYPKKEKELLDLYMTSTLPEKRINELFQWAFEFGYGADKSTGKGVLEITALDQLTFPQDGKRCMALGNFVPAADNKLKGLRANIMTKFGKLGGHFVTSRNPFKKPILMYKAGATFECPNSTPYVGTLLENIHKDPEIRHHAFAPVIRYREEVSK